MQRFRNGSEMFSQKKPGHASFFLNNKNTQKLHNK